MSKRTFVFSDDSSESEEYDFCNLDISHKISSSVDERNVGVTIGSQLKEIQELFERGTSTLQKCHKYIEGKKQMKDITKDHSFTDEMVFRLKIRNLEEEKKAVLEENMQLKKQLLAVEMPYHRVNTLTAETKPRPDGFVDKIKTLEEALYETERRFNSMKQEKEEFQSQFAHSQNEHRQLQMKIMDLEEKITTLEKDKLEHDRNYSSLERRFNSLKKDKEEFECQFDVTQDEHQQLQLKIKDLENKITTLEETNLGHEKNYSSLERRFNSMKQEKEKFQSQFAHSQKENQQLQIRLVELEAMQGKTAEQTARLEELQQQLEQVQLMKEVEIKEIYSKLGKEMRQRRPDTVNTMEEYSRWVFEELKKLVSDRATKSNKLREIEEEVAQLQEKLEEERKQHAASIKAINGHVQVLNAQMDEMKRRETELETENAGLKETAQNAQVVQEAEYKKEIEKLKREVKQANDCKPLLQKRLRAAEHQAEEYKNKSEELEGKIKEFKTACEDLDKMVKDKEEEIAALNVRINELTANNMRQRHQANQPQPSRRNDPPPNPPRDPQPAHPLIRFEKPSQEILNFIHGAAERPVDQEEVMECRCPSCHTLFDDMYQLNDHLDRCVVRQWG